MLKFYPFPILRPYRLSVRTQAFQAWKPGSTPGRVTMREQLYKWEWSIVIILLVWFVFHISECHFFTLNKLNTDKFPIEERGIVEKIGELTQEQLADLLSDKYNLEKILKLEMC